MNRLYRERTAGLAVAMLFGVLAGLQAVAPQPSTVSPGAVAVVVFIWVLGAIFIAFAAGLSR